MKIISHRGNINGPDSDSENNPKKIEQALNLGYECEVDVWSQSGALTLCHDFKNDKHYSINAEFLKKDGLWCHAKNIEALSAMIFLGVHCFWHQEDNHTVTSKGFIWSHPKSAKNKSAIHVENNFCPDLIGKCLGICSDNIKQYRDISPDGSKK